MSSRRLRQLKTGGWIAVTVVSHASSGENCSIVFTVAYTFKTRHHDLQLLPACRTRQLRLSETPQLCLRSHSSGVLGERWLCSLFPSVPKCRLALSLLTQATGKGINALLRRTFALVCITVGQIRWSMSVVLLSKKSQITLVVFSLR